MQPQDIPAPYVVLALVVAVVLFWRFAIPAISRRSYRPVSQQPKDVVPYIADQPIHGRLEHLPASVLGAAFARAARREAEDAVAVHVAAEAQTNITGRFTAPFVSAPGQPAAPAPGAHSVTP